MTEVRLPSGPRRILNLPDVGGSLLVTSSTGGFDPSVRGGRRETVEQRPPGERAQLTGERRPRRVERDRDETRGERAPATHGHGRGSSSRVSLVAYRSGADDRVGARRLPLPDHARREQVGAGGHRAGFAEAQPAAVRQGPRRQVRSVRGCGDRVRREVGGPRQHLVQQRPRAREAGERGGAHRLAEPILERRVRAFEQGASGRGEALGRSGRRSPACPRRTVPPPRRRARRRTPACSSSTRSRSRPGCPGPVAPSRGASSIASCR